MPQKPLGWTYLAVSSTSTTQVRSENFRIYQLVMKLTLVQLLATSLEVHMLDAHKLRTLEKFPEEKQGEEYRQADISGDEGIDIP